MRLFSKQIITFNRQLHFEEQLPKGIQIMNPYQSQETFKISSKFYQQFYNDRDKRILILGINPGRHGAGVTGIPFTDSERLEKNCQISAKHLKTRELSAVFIYEMIEAWGGMANQF